MQLQRGNLIRILVTGADGFLGKNLQLHLRERSDVELRLFTRDDPLDRLAGLVNGADFIFHLAGINRPEDPNDFLEGNAELTRLLVNAVQSSQDSFESKPTIVFASSTQAVLDNPYGKSKKLAEDYIFSCAKNNFAHAYVFRLPNVFGKWARPNYNSAVATFCHNIARDLPIQINDPSAPISLVYVDDVMTKFLSILDRTSEPDLGVLSLVTPVYQTTVGEVANKIQAFRQSRESLYMDRVGTGLTRALYATYVSYLPVESFAYSVLEHIDPRGNFVEMLKTPDCGQFSFFTAHPGVTRGGHYHHTKTEKFLVIKGQALFRFRHMQTGQYFELQTSGESPNIVETVPGWTHDISNIGDEDMIVMLWANEVFDPNNPDTFKSSIQ